MKSLLFLFLFLGFLTAGCTHKHVPGAGDVDDAIMTDELLVVLNPGYERSTVEAAFSRYSLELNDKHERDGETAWKVGFDEESIRADKLLVELADYPGVKEANFVMKDKHH